MSSDRYVDTLRLSENEINGVMRRLQDRSAAAGRTKRDKDEGANRRQQQRYNYRVFNLVGVIEHPGGTVSRVVVCSRNLSAGGISFIHGAFVYPGSKCKFVLNRLDGGVQPVAGVVRTCRHLDGKLHEIGVKFDCAIEPGSFVRDVVDVQGAGADSVETAPIRLNVLLVDPTETEQGVVRRTLTSAGVTLIAVPTLNDMPAAIKSGRCDVAIVGLPLDSAACTAIRSLAGKEHPKLVILLTEETSGVLVAGAREAGVHEIVPKPVDPRLLIRILSKFATAPPKSLPLSYSRFERDQLMQKQIQEYVEQTVFCGIRLRQAIDGDRLKEVVELCRNLKTSAAQYGFDALANIANETITSLESSFSIPNSRELLEGLVAACNRVSIREAA